MNAFAIAGLFVAIPSVMIGVFTLAKRRKKIHLIWGLFSFSVALWGFGVYKIATTLDITKAIFWWQIAEIGVILIPVLLTHFVLEFLSLRKRLFLYIFYTITFLLLYCDLFTNYFVNQLRFVFDQFYYISPATPLYTFFVFVIFLGSVVYSTVLLALAYKKSQGIIKSQIKYLVWAFVIGFSGGATSYLPVYHIDVLPVWNATIFLSALIVAYAISRYRLMDIRIVTRKISIYFVSAAFTYGIFFFLVWIFNRFLGGVFTNTAYLSGLIIAPLFVGAFLWFFGFIQKVANRYFFLSLYNYQETINNLSQKLNYLNDLDEIINLIVDTVKEVLQLDKAGVLLIEENGEIIHYRIAKVIGFNEKNGISLVQDNFLTQRLKETQKLLVREELNFLAKDSKNEEERKGFSELESNMERIEASLCLPLMSSKKLIGIIVLGSKVSGDAYTIEDLELLSTLAFQAGIAIDNARLYREIQDFSKTLQQKVDEQTKEIKDAYQKVEKAYEVEKQAHEELKKVDKAKTQFMLVTQHHLRTPLTSMMGYLDLLLAGEFGRISTKAKETLQKLETSTLNEIKIVNDLLNVSEFQLGRGYIESKQGVKIMDIIKEIIKDFSAEAKDKGIYLKIGKSDELPLISADKTKLKLAITNIIDNAVKYTKQGGVTVNIKHQKSESKNNDKLQIIVKDTGIGLPKESLQDLFNQTFHRGEEAQKLFAVGKGIGLFLSAKIIEAHKGRIWAESEGEGKGSTFYIELPTE